MTSLMTWTSWVRSAATGLLIAGLAGCSPLSVHRSLDCNFGDACGCDKCCPTTWTPLYHPTLWRPLGIEHVGCEADQQLFPAEVGGDGVEYTVMPTPVPKEAPVQPLPEGNMDSDSMPVPPVPNVPFNDIEEPNNRP